MLINKNSVYQWIIANKEDPMVKQIRVIFFTEKHVIFVGLEKEGSVPNVMPIDDFLNEIDFKNLKKISDPYLKYIEEDSISEKHKKIRDEAWKIVQYLWIDQLPYPKILFQEYRMKEVIEAAKHFQCSANKIIRVMKKYWQRGMTLNALLPDYDNCGAPGSKREPGESKLGRPRNPISDSPLIKGINIDEPIRNCIECSLDLYYKGSKPSLTEAYNKMLIKFFSDRFTVNGKEKVKIWGEDRIPSKPQYYYHANQLIDLEKKINDRESLKAFALKHRNLPSNSTLETFGPGSTYEIDATTIPLYLVSKTNRNRIIGKPVVYAVIDVYSRMIVGLYVGLEGPSWLGAMMAMDNVVADKVEFCKEYGIEICEEQWPSKYLSETIRADRGEFEGDGPENLRNNLGITIENTAPYRGDLKPIVERRFRTVKEFVRHKSPGAIQKEFRERGDKDYRLNATLTLREFTEIIIRLVLRYNSSPIKKYPRELALMSEEIQPIPLHIWTWGVANRKGAFLEKDRDIVRLNLFPQAWATITREGIKYKKDLYYSSSEFVENKWFLTRLNERIKFMYDPRHMDCIYIPQNRGSSYIKCNLLNKSRAYKGLDAEEIIFLHELGEEQLRGRTSKQNQINANTDLEIDKIQNNAIKETAKYRSGSARSRIKDIKPNRAEEKERIRGDQFIELGPKNVNVEPGQVVGFPTPPKQDHSDDSDLELLIRKRDEKFE